MAFLPLVGNRGRINGDWSTIQRNETFWIHVDACLVAFNFVAFSPYLIGAPMAEGPTLIGRTAPG